jgi:peptide/nickel transport system permease protein
VTGFLLRRLTASFLLLLLILSLTFFLLHLVPGDPFGLFGDRRLRPEQRARLYHIYGLDRPLAEQYLSWITAALRGDWGVSLSQQRSVGAAIAEAVPPTLLLAGAALLVETVAALAMGIAAARWRGRAIDSILRAVSLFLFSQPLFWLSLMAILVFAYLWPILPASHMHSVGADEKTAFGSLIDLLRHLLLPSLLLGLASAGGVARIVRASLVEVMGQDYVRTARAKGLSERRVLLVHGLRTALVPVIQLFGVSLPSLLSGALIVEVVFSWPGLGRLTFGAIAARDYPLVLATTAWSALLVLLGSLLADLLHAWADPRVRS